MDLSKKVSGIENRRPCVLTSSWVKRSAPLSSQKSHSSPLSHSDSASQMNDQHYSADSDSAV